MHLSKGCYRGQETVAKVHNLGHPPRRLVMLQLDGSEGVLPSPGDEVALGDTVVGRVTSAGLHYELGPIALAVVKRTHRPRRRAHRGLRRHGAGRRAGGHRATGCRSDRQGAAVAAPGYGDPRAASDQVDDPHRPRRDTAARSCSALCRERADEAAGRVSVG